jgi:serine/threonine protein kinase
LDIADGLKYLHDNNVVHGDLHGSNVLVDDNERALLSDFGRAKVIGHQGYSTYLVAGCAEFMAPELLSNDEEDEEENDGAGADRGPPFSKMSDIYAFSMLMFQVCVPGRVIASVISSSRRYSQIGRHCNGVLVRRASNSLS